jgi:HAD superfamily hydrolase (TIGR01509 family)
MLKAALFDFDGTLIDSDRSHIAAFRKIHAPHDITVSPELYADEMMGRSNAEIFRRYFPRASAMQLVELGESKEQAYLERGHLVTCHEGAIEVLQALRTSGVHLALVTNAPRLVVETVGGRLKLLSYLDAIVTIEDVANGKPDPAPYRLALARLGADARSAIAIEDSPSGIALAAAAGLRVLWFSPSGRASSPSWAGVGCIRSLREVLLLGEPTKHGLGGVWCGSAGQERSASPDREAEWLI